ncbi:hypothetical protein TEA_029256 [Camellia sinensis var. sinensis]|uniref:Uncharacterized protein n=1 Tax=Camellia sinensis var. sinensis TaxID=542762 RepID=A0A4S4DN26_CAMSN|nr:hypothetical protein TEA_029256 [Camellia sinensis var. sinensis]
MWSQNFDNEIDMHGLETYPGVKRITIKPQTDKWVFPDTKSGIIRAQRKCGSRCSGGDSGLGEVECVQQCEQQTNNSQQSSISSNINSAPLGFMQASSPEVRRHATVRDSTSVRGSTTVRGPTPLRGPALIRGSASTSVRDLAPTSFRGPSPTQFRAPATRLPMRTTQPMPPLRPPIVGRMYIVNGQCRWGPRSN